MYQFKASGGFGMVHTASRKIVESQFPQQEKYVPAVQSKKLVKLQSSKDLATAIKLGLNVNSYANSLMGPSPVFIESGSMGKPPTHILHSPNLEVWKKVFKGPVKGKRVKYNMAPEPGFEKFFKGEYVVTDIRSNEELLVSLFSDTGRLIGEFIFNKRGATRV